eukprot:gene15030-16580_t
MSSDLITSTATPETTVPVQRCYCCNMTNLKQIVAILIILSITLTWFYSKQVKIFISSSDDYGWKSLELQNGKDTYTFNYKVIRQTVLSNRARMSSARDPKTRDILRDERDKDKFHVVTTFVPFDHSEVKGGLLIYGDREPTDTELQARMAEITECLQNNLNHKLVAFVHMLVYRQETIDYLRHLDLTNSDKLILHKADESPTMKQEIAYATKYLTGKLVLITHQDNYIKDEKGGWDKVDRDMMKRKRLMYALTRHQQPSRCPGASTSAHCDGQHPYIGSHDTFVFYVNSKVPIEDHQLVELDVTPNTSGIENVLLWIFRKRLGYRVTNPCKVLIMYHNHCLPIRDSGRQRINTDKNGLAYFTDNLS